MPTKPIAFTPARELQTFHWSDWDSVGRAKNAIRALEAGQFNLAAKLADAMMRDDRVSGCLLTRTESMPAFPRTIEPSKVDGRRGTAIAKEIDDKFPSFFPDAALGELNRWGVLLGLGLGQMLWKIVDGSWDFVLQVWHPQFVSWRMDTRSYWVSTESGQIEVKPGDRQWVLHTPYGYERAWMGGLVRSLYIPWLIRQFGLRDWARWSEVHGNPIKKGYIPKNADEDDKDRFISEISRLATESTIVLPQTSATGGVNRDGFDVALMEASSSGTDGFDKLLSKAETAISVRILGQNLSTEVKGGSFAAAAVHANVRNDILAADANNLGACLRDQALGPWAEVNYGKADLAPTPRWNTDPSEDKLARAQAQKATAEAIVALQTTGAQVDVDELLDAAEIPVTGPAQPPPTPVVVAPPGNGDPNAPPPKPPATKQPIAKASQKDDHQALIEGQVYADQIADREGKQGAHEIQPDLHALLAIVKTAPSYDELRRRLEQLPGMHSAKLAIVLEKALVLADLNGRLAVLEDL